VTRVHPDPLTDRPPMRCDLPTRQAFGNINKRLISDTVGTVRRRRFLPAPRAAPAVNRSTSLAAERSHLHIVRDEHDQKVTEAIARVSALDARLATPAPTHQSQTHVGTFEHFPCPYEGGFVAWRYHGVGGRDLVVRLPAELDVPEADAATRRFMTELLAIQERIPIG
jgi:hypothetical protein